MSSKDGTASEADCRSNGETKIYDRFGKGKTGKNSIVRRSKRNVIKKHSQDTLELVGIKAREKWMTSDMLDMMER